MHIYPTVKTNKKKKNEYNVTWIQYLILDKHLQ